MTYYTQIWFGGKFLRYIRDLSKYGPDRPIFGYSPHMIFLFDIGFFIFAGKNDVNHSKISFMFINVESNRV